MDQLTFNFLWMAWNLFLAFLGYLFAWLIVRFKDPIAKIAFTLLWLLFVPNTVYVLTDLIHIPYQLPKLPVWGQFILMGQYLTLLVGGCLAFLRSLQLFEHELVRWLKQYHLHKHRILFFTVMIGINFLIALGVAMGRYQRTNSWYILTNPGTVVQDLLVTLTSSYLMVFVLLFGIGINCLYLGSRLRLEQGSNH